MEARRHAAKGAARRAFGIWVLLGLVVTGVLFPTFDTGSAVAYGIVVLVAAIILGLSRRHGAAMD